MVYEFHIKVDSIPHFHIHPHANTRTQFIAVQPLVKEAHALFNRMLTSIKEGSYILKKNVIFSPCLLAMEVEGG